MEFCHYQRKHGEEKQSIKDGYCNHQRIRNRIFSGGQYGRNIYAGINEQIHQIELVVINGMHGLSNQRIVQVSDYVRQVDQNHPGNE